MPSFDLLLRRITPRHSTAVVPASPASPVTPEMPPVAALVEPQPEEPGYFRQALIDARLRWAKDVQRAAAQQSRRPSAPAERVVFTDQYVPPPPRRPSVESIAVDWWD
jgi:hypothetical protein